MTCIIGFVDKKNDCVWMGQIVWEVTDTQKV